MSTLDLIKPSSATTPQLTETKYVDWVGEKVHTEWVAGEVRVKPAIDEIHDLLQSAIKESVRALVRKTRQGGQVRGDEFAMRLPQSPSYREPDLIYIATDNPSLLSRTLLTGPCDVVLEVVSPVSVDEDYSYKFSEYQAAGIREYWLIDPMRKSITAHRWVDGKYAAMTADEHNRLHSTVIAGWWLSAEALFKTPTPDALDLMRLLGVV